jgi:DegV family protein with EDD domain
MEEIMKVRIVVDSVADVKKEIAERLTVVPLNINFGDEQYVDGETMTKEQFYQKLATSSDMPRTSQPSPAAFESVYEEAKKEGESLVVLTVSSKLSGTFQSANIAAMDFPGQVYVVDTRSAAIGVGVLAEYANGLAKQGLSAEEIVAKLETEKHNVVLLAALDTLDYLVRGGRLSKVAGIAGGLLNIKPVITLENGEIIVAGKARGTKQANAMMNKGVAGVGGVDTTKPMLFGFTGLSDDLLQKYLSESTAVYGDAQLDSTLISGAIGTHVGPGAYAVAFFKNA